MELGSRNRLNAAEKRDSCTSKWKEMLHQCLQVVMTVMVVNVHTMSPTHSDDVTYSSVSSAPSFALHPRISELHPDNFQGAEGSKVSGLELKKSVIIFTSGLVPPPAHITKHPSLSADISHLCDFKSYASNHKSSKVQSYQEILSLKEKTKRRQVKRSGFKVFEAVTAGEVCQPGRLTAGGVSQMIQLGEHLFRSYAATLQSLNGNTRLERLAEAVGDPILFQSMSGLLHGLLNEKQFVSVDVAKLPHDYDAGSYAKDKSLQFKNQLHHLVDKAYKTENLLFKESGGDSSGSLAELPAKDVLAYLLNIVHSKLRYDGETDNLSAFDDLNLSIWDVDRLFNSSDSYNSYLASCPVFQVYANHHTYSLRQHILKFLREPVEDDGKGNLRLLAVDDLMMLSLLVSMNLSVDKHLQPASRLVMEVFESPPAASPLNTLYLPTDSFIKNFLPSHNSKLEGSHIVSKMSPDSKDGNPSLLSSLHLITSLTSKGPHILKALEVSGALGPMKQKPLELVRVLLNGQVITPSLSACSDDEFASLGLCAAEKIQSLLSSFRDVNGWKDEL
ncbi:hypothetical protein Btru_013040 [Bulinus truncatus]|nr:hypothetical protein Btru_013040 [Bulinus truncatus]